MSGTPELAERRMTHSTRERLLDLVRQILGPPASNRPLPIDARLTDLGMSSIKMVNLMLSVESAFDIAIPAADINPDNFATLASIEALISRMLETSASL
jgi:acyl carrier protein